MVPGPGIKFVALLSTGWALSCRWGRSCHPIAGLPVLIRLLRYLYQPHRPRLPTNQIHDWL